MPARRARRPGTKKQLAVLPKKHPEVAKVIDTSLFIDGQYSHRETVVEMRSGPPEDQVRAKAEITVCDGEDDSKVDTVLVHWTVNRDRFRDGNLTVDERAMNGTTFRLDEIEPWVTALYEAVKFAKKQGYLPTGGIQS